MESKEDGGECEGTAHRDDGAGRRSGGDDDGAEHDKQRAQEEAFLRFRLTYIDTVQSSPLDLPPAPTESDRSTPFIPARRVPFVPVSSNIVPDRVPELRIFGATEAGQRCCVHVHGAMPYIYVEYEGKVSPEDVHNHINRLARAINVCMAASLGRKDANKSLFIAFIVPVKAVPFYGFHVGYRYFLKIYCLDPKFMTRMCTLLRSGEIMHKRWIVYEGHIPFHLQFMLDSNLYGCGWVGVSKVKFREPVPEQAELASSAESSEYALPTHLPDGETMNDTSTTHRPRNSSTRFLTRDNIPPEMLYGKPEDSPARVSHSALEFDIHVSWILNRHLVNERNLHADFTEFLHRPIPDDYKFVHSVRELWEDERKRRRMQGMEGPFEVSENSAAEALGGLTAGPRSAPKGADGSTADPDARMYGIGTQPPWQRFNENKEHFASLVQKDEVAYAELHPNKPVPDFETFARKERKGGYMEMIRTSFQAVEALFEETMIQDELTGNPFGAWAVRGMGIDSAEHRAAASRNATDRLKNENERASSVDLDVNPHYLAMLATQDGRSRLAQLEQEDIRVETYNDFDDNHDDGSHLHGPGQAVMIQAEAQQPASDEEELRGQDERFKHEERQHLAHLAETHRGESPAVTGDDSRNRLFGDLPPNAARRDTSEEGLLEDDDAAMGIDFDPLSRSDSPHVARSAQDDQNQMDGLDEDPDLALLNSLVPLDPLDGSCSENEEERKPEPGDLAAAQIPATLSSQSRRNADDLKRAGLEDIR